MSIALASMQTWLMRALAAMAMLACVASTGSVADHAEIASFAEATQATIEAVGDEIADLDSSLPTADDPAPLDLLPAQGPIVGPFSSRSRHVASDDSVASLDVGHLDRPPRSPSADAGRVNVRGA